MKLKNLLNKSTKKNIKSVIRFIININKKKYLKFDNYWVQRVKIKSVPNRIEYFKKMCTNKNIIHFGCTDWPIFNPNKNLHIELSKYTNLLHGFDIDLEGIKNLKHYVNQDYFSDFSEIPDIQYDVCLIPETIEHVGNVELFLKNVSLINANIYVITAPNCFSKEHINRNFYGTDQFIELVHPDHNCWYSPYTLKNQIEKYTNLKVSDVVLIEKDTMVCCIARKNPEI
jgi:hypothetical protein